MRSDVRSRLAPTPSGFLHIGNAFSFVLTWLLVRHQQGSLLLRIDDGDQARTRPEYVEDIFNTLHWMGLQYDAGPHSPEDFFRHFSQKLRTPQYIKMLSQLRQQGILYACNCSRSEIQASSPDGIYHGTCRHKELDLDSSNVAWRVRVPKGTRIAVRDLTNHTRTVALDQAMGDFIVRRRDGLPSYQIESLSDDLHYRINLIVRGEDLLASTAAQLFLARYLPANSFADVTFCHHSILTDQDGRKLSKSTGSPDLRSLRRNCESPADLYRQFANLLGISPASVNNLDHLLARFSLTCLSPR
jgi:glutamyl-tRNA synthetase